QLAVENAKANHAAAAGGVEHVNDLAVLRHRIRFATTGIGAVDQVQARTEYAEHGHRAAARIGRKQERTIFAQRERALRAEGIYRAAAAPTARLVTVWALQRSIGRTFVSNDRVRVRVVGHHKNRVLRIAKAIEIVGSLRALCDRSGDGERQRLN